MTATTTIEKLFSGKSLVIPGYQRDYAWNERNANELIEDVGEALEGPGHYLGTFILSQKKSDKAEPFHVVDGQQRLPALSIADLVALAKVGLSVEHILPQEPNFNLEAYGFANNDEYVQHLHRLGNLMLLEQPINSACNNSTVEQKITAQNLYHASSLCTVGVLAAKHAHQRSYQKDDVNIRSKALAELVATRWPIGGGVAAAFDANVAEEEV